ncbi:MAG TPA: shikimate dehydrogenase [Anaerolineales bacterium]|nr:shikimate dehydrogenase [Anaerolineales bacterium]
MIQLGLIGFPLEHSLSPRLHEAALKSSGVEGNYSLFPIEPDDGAGLRSLLARVRDGEITGLNITIPHKQNVIALLDELTPTAESIGAVNTIYCHQGKLIGDNTDVHGFLADLNRFLTKDVQRHGASKALVLGAGGSARAVVYALGNEGWTLTLAARDIKKAQRLAHSFANYQLRLTDFNLSNIELSNIDLIVNTTPLGMFPNIDRSPWPQDVPFPPHAAIYDLVYNPGETKLVRDARQQGLQATTGLGMLIEQAALSFNIWTNQNPSRALMRAAVDETPVSNLQSPITSHGAS